MLESPQARWINSTQADKKPSDICDKCGAAVDNLYALLYKDDKLMVCGDCYDRWELAADLAAEAAYERMQEEKYDLQ